MLKNVLKLVFLGVVGFGLLVYLTAQKPKNIEVNKSENQALTIKRFPQKVELVGQNNLVSTNKLFKSKVKTLLVVGNHDSLMVVKDLTKYFQINIPYVVVANISNAPWFIKKWAIPGKLEELNKNSTTPMIYDYDGNIITALNEFDSTKTKGHL